jgi:dUTP pyrophosphatase
MLQVIFEKVHPAAIMPTKATPGAACWDVYSVEDATVQFGKVTIVDLGFKVQIPPGYEIVIRPRSGLAFKNGITIVNAPGTIDSDYRGLMKVVLTKVHNETIKVISPMGASIMVTDYFSIKKGDRIAQIALKKLEEYEFIDGVVDDTQRGEGGFGSTGR